MLGYVFWHSLDRVARVRQARARSGSGSSSAWSSALVWLVRHFRDEENRAAASTAAVRGRWTARWLRVAARRSPMWLRGPARFFLARLTPGQLGLELTTLLAIAAVGVVRLHRLRGSPSTDGRHARRPAVSTGSRRPRTTRSWTSPRRSRYLGSPRWSTTVVALVVLLLLVRRRLMEALVLVAGMVADDRRRARRQGRVDRPRPPDDLVDAAGSSFPSGHAAYAIAWVALAIIAVARRPRAARQMARRGGRDRCSRSSSAATRRLPARALPLRRPRRGGRWARCASSLCGDRRPGRRLRAAQ